MYSDNYFLAQICMFPFGFAPAGFSLCNGMELNTREYEALYALIGTKFGGSSNESTFCLPNIEGPQKGVAYYICISGIFPPRN